MKIHSFTAVASTVILGLGLILSGCQSESTGDKMGMTTGSGMSDGKMSDDKMAMEKMDSGSMMAGKMEDGKMADSKMSGEKMEKK